MNMQKWLDAVKKEKIKKAMPLLSFPSVSLLGVKVRDLIYSAELQAEGMALIAKRYDSLASVSMMDLSVEAEAFGAEILVSDDEVPTVKNIVVDSFDKAKNLKIPTMNEGRLKNCVRAVKLAKEKIVDRPVFAGVIGPFSLAGRLMGVGEAMINCYDEPEMVHEVLQRSTDFLLNYILEYKRIGANGVVMAEPLTGMLSPSLAEEFSAPYVKRLVDAVQDDSFIVIYHNCGDNVNLMVDSILGVGAAAYHFGNSVKISEMLSKMPEDKVVMGNVDPAAVIKNGTPETVRESVLSIMSDACEYPNFVISSGCDIPHQTKFENLDAFFAAVNEFYETKFCT